MGASTLEELPDFHPVVDGTELIIIISWNHCLISVNALVKEVVEDYCNDYGANSRRNDEVHGWYSI